MRSIIASLILFCIVCCGVACQKEISVLSLPVTAQPAESTKPEAGTGSFVAYTILRGQQYCVGNTYPPCLTSALRFAVRFDSTAIYTNELAGNQYDYNKLYGFSDNRSDHHSFSARFGWRWCNSQIELSAYTYSDGVRSIKDLGGIKLNKDHHCAILVNGSHYHFVLDGDTTTVPRTSTTMQAIGYKLYPYFGGDEAAPHNITIRIKETE